MEGGPALAVLDPAVGPLVDDQLANKGVIPLKDGVDESECERESLVEQSVVSGACASLFGGGAVRRGGGERRKGVRGRQLDRERGLGGHSYDDVLSNSMASLS